MASACESVGGVPVRRFAVLDGTNAEALRCAVAGAADAWFLAERQTAGRGRRGRTWWSEPGDLLATRLVTLDPARRPHAPELSFVAALAVADAMGARVDPARVTLKWPNDVMLDGAKCAGILLEASGQGVPMRVAVGIGINLTAKPDMGRPTAHLPGANREALFQRLAEAFAERFALWAREGFAPIAAGWRARAHGLGERVRVETGGRIIEGVALDLDTDGALKLRDDGGVLRRITTGDVAVL